MRKNDLPKRRTAFKFDTPGDRMAGEVKSAKLVDSKFDDDNDQVLLLDLSTVDGPVRYYARRRQQEAIREALDMAGVDDLLPGGWLELEYAGDVDTGGIKPARRWDAVYEPPAESAPKWLEDSSDLFSSLSDEPIGVGELEDEDEDADVS
jgi:hypothetical protein